MKLKSAGTLCSALAISFCMLTSAFAAPAYDTAPTDQTQNKTKYEYRHHDKKAGERYKHEVCKQDKCDIRGIHEHNGVKYVGKKYKGDKKEERRYRYEKCDKDGCDIKGIHEHDNKKYVGKKNIDDRKRRSKT